MLAILIIMSGCKKTKAKKEETENKNNEIKLGEKKVYSYAIKDDAIYLNYNDNTSEAIYNMNTNAKLKYNYCIYKEQKIYVIYTEEYITTVYVDVIDLLNNNVEKFILDEQFYKSEDNRDLNIYFFEEFRFYKYNLKTKNLKEESKIEETDYSVEDGIKGTKFNDKVYYIDDANLMIWNIKTNKKEKVAEVGDEIITKIVAVLNDNDFFYTDRIKLYFKNELIYNAEDDDTIIESIGLINNDNLQIKINNRRQSLSEDKYKYLNYNIKDKKITSMEEGFEFIYDVHSLDIYSNMEPLEKNLEDEKEEKKDYSTVEINGICEKKIKDNLITNIDEEKICELIDMSIDEFKEYKNNFINGENMSEDENEQKNIENARYNFLVLENFIFLSDKKTVNNLTKYLEKRHPSKYNRLFACVYSGVINYYIEDERTNHKIIGFENTGAVIGTNELQTKINDNFIVFYYFRRDTEGRNASVEQFCLNIYKDIEDFKDFKINFDKYKDGTNDFIDIQIYSKSYMDFLE